MDTKTINRLTELLARMEMAPEAEFVGTHGFYVNVKAVAVTHEDEAALRVALARSNRYEALASYVRSFGGDPEAIVDAELGKPVR